MAFALQVRWQESDLSILATDPTVAGSTYSAPSTATATPSTVQSTGASGSNIDSPTPSSSSSNTVAQNEDPTSRTESGIPAGTIIGIVIGVGGMVVVIAVGAIAFCLWRHRRKKREENGTRIESMISGMGDTKASPASEAGGFAPDHKAELDSRARASTLALSEAPADRDAIEMPPLHIAATEMEVPHFVAELPGSMPAGHDDGGQTPETDVPRSPLPTAETSQRESGALGNIGHWKKRSVARAQSQLRPISRSSTSTSSTATTATIEDRRQNQT